MTHRPTTLERAFELARSGTHGTVSDIRKTLNHEGFEDVRSQLTGPSLLRQLGELCRTSRIAAE